MNELWYDKPARRWREALPIGNGMTGVMIYGGTKSETLCFNDSTLWSGYPKDYNSPKSLRYLNKVRELIFAGKNDEADKLAQEKLCGFYSETFLPLGVVKIKMKGVPTGGYSRRLRLDTAVHTVKTDGFTRESFASYPDKIVAYHMECRQPFSIQITMSSKLHHSVRSDDGLSLTGNAPDYAAPNYLRSELFPIKYNEGKGMIFALRCEADTDGRVKASGKRLSIQGATHITLYFATATGFVAFDKMPVTDRQKILEKCKALIKQVTKNYPALKKRHISDFKKVYGKSAISFQNENCQSTDRLLTEAKNGNAEPALVELFYNYGKYMIASGSRDGGQPLNLQGLWNNSRRPPWSSNYTVNINTQMNYWGASRANLDACLEPLLRMVHETMQNGKKTAAVNYGCGGFACNHNVDIWRKTPPVQGTCNYMLEPLCGVWLANEIYSHYQNGSLQEQTGKVHEIVREAARFAADYLILHNGAYVVCPSPSPENLFQNNGKRCALSYASAFDMSLVKQVFRNYLDLQANEELHSRIETMLPALAPYRTGQNGLREWYEDYEIPERGHRHFSPLYAFYPGNEIQYYRDKELTASARKLFQDRINHSNQYIGWSAAWGICLAARLHDRENVQMIMQKFLGHAVFQNLFCVHPPYYFQIDGNLGFVAGVHEMLLYEENNIIELLPALPDRFQNGSAHNLLVKGVQISFAWKHGKVTEIEADKPVTVADSNLAPDCRINEYVHLENKCKK